MPKKTGEFLQMTSELWEKSWMFGIENNLNLGNKLMKLWVKDDVIFKYFFIKVMSAFSSHYQQLMPHNS